MSKLEFPMDMTVVSCRVAMRDLISIIHHESRISRQQERIDFVLVGLQDCVSFMGAILDKLTPWPVVVS